MRTKMLRGMTLADGTIDLPNLKNPFEDLQAISNRRYKGLTIEVQEKLDKATVNDLIRSAAAKKVIKKKGFKHAQTVEMNTEPSARKEAGSLKDGQNSLRAALDRIKSPEDKRLPELNLTQSLVLTNLTDSEEAL